MLYGVLVYLDTLESKLKEKLPQCTAYIAIHAL